MQNWNTNPTSSEMKKIKILPPKLPRYQSNFPRTIVTNSQKSFPINNCNNTNKTANNRIFSNESSDVKASCDSRKLCDFPGNFKAWLIPVAPTGPNVPRNTRRLQRLEHWNTTRFEWRHLLGNSWTVYTITQLQAVLQAVGSWVFYAKRWDSIYLKRIVGYVILL